MFLHLGSIANIVQHDTDFPITYNVVIFEKKIFLKEMVDIIFLKLELSGLPMMYRYCFYQKILRLTIMWHFLTRLAGGSYLGVGVTL